MSHAASVSAAASTPAVRTEKLPPWLFYGILFGLLGAASIVLWGPIGVSGTYPRFIGALMRVFDPSYAEANPYLVKMGSLLKPESFLVVGLLIGGFIGARANREKAPACEMIHPSETTTAKRYRDAFIGGFLIVFGARIAGGCTSGHIISGITQLSVSGFIFAIGTFATGIMSAKMLHGRRTAGV
ncbi:MAG: YeeE/YedE family protein [Gemmatimonadaceae bacterium]|nr:YeeE/YedE family protein [Gemmatimonadaceae bacterium]